MGCRIYVRVAPYKCSNLLTYLLNDTIPAHVLLRGSVSFEGASWSLSGWRQTASLVWSIARGQATGLRRDSCTTCMYVSASASLDGAAAQTAATRKSVNGSSMLICRSLTFSSELLLRRWAQWTFRHRISWTIWAVRSVLHVYLVMIEQDISSVSGWRSVTLQRYNADLLHEVSLSVMAWTSSFEYGFNFLFFHPRDLILPTV